MSKKVLGKIESSAFEPQWRRIDRCAVVNGFGSANGRNDVGFVPNGRPKVVEVGTGPSPEFVIGGEVERETGVDGSTKSVHRCRRDVFG